MSEYYMLKDKIAIPCDLMSWARWFEKADRHVAKSGGPKGERPWISTVFLGLNHNSGDGPPLLFETMIFGGEHDQYQVRCSTWKQAEAMHAKACKLAGIKL